MHPEAERCLKFIVGMPKGYVEQRLQHLEFDIKRQTELRSSWMLGREYCYQELAYWNRKEQNEVYRGKHLMTIKHFEAWERWYTEKLKIPDPRKWMEEVCDEIRKILGTNPILGEDSMTSGENTTQSVTATASETTPAAASAPGIRKRIRFIDDD